MRVSQAEYKKLVGKHSDMTMQDTLPDASKQFAALERKVAKQEKRIRTLEAQVQKMFGKHLNEKNRRRHNGT